MGSLNTSSVSFFTLQFVEWLNLHVTQELHLFKYHCRHLEYLKILGGQKESGVFAVGPPTSFSGPYEQKGYNDKTITDDMITDVLLEFNERSRRQEASEFTRTLTGI